MWHSTAPAARAASGPPSNPTSSPQCWSTTKSAISATAPDAANVLFHLVNAGCVQRRCCLFTTNKALKDWGAALHACELAEAIVDRVLERGRIVSLEGPSMHTRHLLC